MKTKSILAMSLMAALAVGCSSDDITDDGGKNPVATEGQSYVSLNITLPSTNGTRAEGDDSETASTDPTFDKGDANEYKVNSVKITLYKKENNSYTQIETLNYSSDELAWVAGTNDITTTALLPVKQVTFNPETDAYALVEVNPITEEGFTVSATENNAVTTTAEKLTGTEQNAFFMTNAVQHDGSFLVSVKSYKTELEAQNNAKNYNVYVERAVAKATLKVGTGEHWGTDEGAKTTYTISSDGSVYNGAKVKIDAWKLDVTNKKMYPIRKFAGTETYTQQDYLRFYGANTYRTYWAEDPNYNDYNKNNQTDNFNVITEATNITNEVGKNEYCLENTFNTTHQKQNETTRVLVKATYTPNITFSDGDGTTWYTIGNSTTAYTKTSLQTAIKNALNTESEVTLSELNAGETTIATTTFKVGTSDASEDQVATIKNVLGSKITTYKNGECYYAIRIKHFGDDVCPWTEGVDYTSTENKETLEKSYLGRYGVVRNNWYQVTINSVSQPGSPTIPELTEEQDDVVKYYLQANIHILDWAVRTQGVDL